LLTIVDVYTGQYPKIHVARKIALHDGTDHLAELFVACGTPDYTRSDNGPEFVAESVRGWFQRLCVKTLFIKPGCPWENGYIKAFNGRFRDELLNGEIIGTILEARILTEQWRRECLPCRPASS